MNQIITIKDIARKFKCSPSTVSRALNDYPLINIETRKNIQEYAQRMGYQKNYVSLNLLNKSSKAIGIIVPGILHSHETTMLEGIQSELNTLGYTLNFCISNESLAKEAEHIERLKQNRVAGMLISLSQESFSSNNTDHLNKLLAGKMPFVFMDREAIGENFHSVTIDNYAGAYLATQHLIATGCKNIAHIAGPAGMKVSEDRKRGYLHCLSEKNIPINENLIIHADFNIESASKPVQYLFDQHQTPDAIFGVNDDVCFGAMKVLRQKHIPIPDQVSIIGFDNNPYSSFFNPALSTINRKSFEIGALAARKLIDLILAPDKVHDPIHKILQPELILRQTTKLI